jgi:hypothetical protein
MVASMVRNKHVMVENENGKGVLLSAAIIVEYLKDYTSDWGNLSGVAKIEDISSDFPMALEPAMNVFNSKIGYVVPKTMLNSLINDVMVLLKKEKKEYLTMFQSFNNLEKVAIYFILMINKERTPEEVFDIINSNYKDISKRDIMIKLLSEVDVEESTDTVMDPINGLYKLLATTQTHSANPEPKFNISVGNLEFREFTFPMHSYNTNKKFGWIRPVHNNTIRNYFDRYNQAWKTSGQNIINSWMNSSSVLYWSDHWKDTLKNDITNTIGGVVGDYHKKITNYKDLLNSLSHKENPVGTANKNLIKQISEKFFDFNPNSSTLDDQASTAPLTITKFMSNSTVRDTYFDSNNLKAGTATYHTNFSNLKTFLAYYASDINLWLTSDNSASNTAYNDYLHTQDANGLLTSNSKSETKGYFSNVMFIQSAIQRVLYPRILKDAQGGYSTNSLDEIFNIDKSVYDTIFDSIVNNAFVYTDKNSPSNVFDANYEIIPNRAILSTRADGEYIINTRDFINVKSTNLYEFMINTLVNSKDKIRSDGTRKIIGVTDLEEFNRQSLMYKGTSINYNPMSSKISNTSNSLTVQDFNSGSIVYNFGDTYNPTSKNWISSITDTFFKTQSGDPYSKINYRNIKFFKYPVHSANSSITNNINRNITRVNRELLTDISDLVNYDIEGLSLADFTYGEKALLREYIDNFKSVKRKRSMSDIETIKEMLKELLYLSEWKAGPSAVKINNPANSYYRVSEEANPMPSIASTNWNDPGYNVFINWVENLANLKKTIYFPEFLTSNDINDIESLLNRAIISIQGNRRTSSNVSLLRQSRELVKNSAISVQYQNNGSWSNRKMILNSIGNYFLTAFKLIISTIKNTDEYQTAFSAFDTQYKTGNWTNTSATLSAIKDVLLNETLINNAIYSNNLYTGFKSGLLKDLDMGLYRLFINNYFDYITDGSEPVVNRIDTKIFVDNSETGIIRYYSDILLLLKFADKYHELLPEYVRHLNSDILSKYYERIKAIKSLPTWDYESLHRRDREVDLKNSGGINSHDYNITWSRSDSNIRMIYKNGGTYAWSYKVSSKLYSGGMYMTSNGTIRDRWWRKWITNGADVFSYTDANLFKIPSVTVKDNNIQLPTTWQYDNPDKDAKLVLFEKMKNNTDTYQSGKIANITSIKYSSGSSSYYENIGVPLLLLGDDASEWNKANTVRENSFSFETEFMNLWHTDEKYNDGGTHNNGGGEAYTSSYELVSGADKYRNFGLGSMDLQQMFRHLWNMESSPMGNPYTVMNYDIFKTWDDDYQSDKGDFPWSTLWDDTFRLFSDKIFSQRRKVSNKYGFKFVLKNSYGEGVWSPVRLSGEDRTIGVDADITNDQIYDNFYLNSTYRTFSNNTRLKNAIFDIYNRNFRNRIYLTYLKWRYYNKLGVW